MRVDAGRCLKKKKTHIASQELVPAHFLPGVETFFEGGKEAEESRWSAITAGTERRAAHG